MKDFTNTLKSKLEKREREGTLRKLQVNSGFTDFYSNDYLGLSREQHVSGANNSPGSSRLIAGTTAIHVETERNLAHQFHAEAALLFNSGYSANVGLFSAIGSKDVIIIYDERSHASIKDGIRLSFSKALSFKHNDIEDLARLLGNHQDQQCLVVAESLYSIDGDFSPLKEIVELCKKYGALCIVDEAHTGGVIGKSGYCAELGMLDDVFARVFTFGKAYGCQGACVVGKKVLIDYLTNFARSFIYTTALPSSVVDEINHKVTQLKLTERQELLQNNIKYFREKTALFPSLSGEQSPIQSLQIGSAEKAKKLEQLLFENKISTKAIVSPTTPQHHEVVRISIHSFNTLEEIDNLVQQIQSVWKSL
jgi:8-amino-7-oxononanoate synthase